MDDYSSLTGALCMLNVFQLMFNQERMTNKHGTHDENIKIIHKMTEKLITLESRLICISQ